MVQRNIPGSAARLAVVAAFALLAASSVIPVASAQTQQDFWNATSRTFYLHLAQYCERDVSLIRWIDEFDWPNDLDGCGGQVQEADNSWTDLFPGFVPLHANVTAQTTAEMHLFILSRAVDQTTVEATYDLGYATCTGAVGPEILMQEKVGGFHEFVIPCTFELQGTPNPLAQPNLTVKVTATHTYGYGTEEEHASFVTLTGVTPAPPEEDVQFFEEGERPLAHFEQEEIELVDLPDARAKGNSPAGGSLALLALGGAVAAAATFLRRRG